jgi:hypothetical protein
MVYLVEPECRPVFREKELIKIEKTAVFSPGNLQTQWSTQK